jgi:hypothetical protein
MKKWQKVLLGVAVLLGGLAIAGKFAFDYAADKAMKKFVGEITKDPEIEKILQDKDVQKKLEDMKSNPDVQKDIEKMAKQGAPSSMSSAASSATGEATKSGEGNKGGKEKASSGTIHFKDTSEAARYAMKRFSMSEINYYRGLADGGLTSAEKKEIKAVVLSRFSSEEIKAFIEVARK